MPITIYQLGRVGQFGFNQLKKDYSRPRDHNRRKPEQWQIAAYSQEQAIWLLRRQYWLHQPYDHVGILAHKPNLTDYWHYWDSQKLEPSRYNPGDQFKTDQFSNVEQFFRRLSEIVYEQPEEVPDRVLQRYRRKYSQMDS